MRTAGCVAAVLLCGCGSQPSSPGPTGAGQPRKLDVAGCENVYRLTDKLISGGEPRDESALRALAELGVRTIITVDGAKPPAHVAAKYGLRYVHLPVGYDGIPKPRILELARGLRDLPGLVYLHCHHGLHRGPAASAAALVALGERSPDEAVEIMKALGTSPKYEGLYADVKELKTVPGEVDRAGAEFPAAAKLPGFVASMAEADRRFEHLAETRKAGWKKTREHPDIDPPHEALQLRDIFAEFNRTEFVKSKPEKFRLRMADTESAAGALEAALRRADGPSADRAFLRIDANCRACHQDHRDTRREK